MEKDSPEQDNSEIRVPTVTDEYRGTRVEIASNTYQNGLAKSVDKRNVRSFLQSEPSLDGAQRNLNKSQVEFSSKIIQGKEIKTVKKGTVKSSTRSKKRVQSSYLSQKAQIEKSMLQSKILMNEQSGKGLNSILYNSYKPTSLYQVNQYTVSRIPIEGQDNCYNPDQQYNSSGIIQANTDKNYSSARQKFQSKYSAQTSMKNIKVMAGMNETAFSENETALESDVISKRLQSANRSGFQLKDVTSSSSFAKRSFNKSNQNNRQFSALSHLQQGPTSLNQRIMLEKMQQLSNPVIKESGTDVHINFEDVDPDSTISPTKGLGSTTKTQGYEAFVFKRQVVPPQERLKESKLKQTKKEDVIKQMQNQIFNVMSSNDLTRPNWNNQRQDTKQVRTDHLQGRKGISQLAITSRVKFQAQKQAEILAKLGILNQTDEEQNEEKLQQLVPKSRAKFLQREKKFNAKYKQVLNQWKANALQQDKEENNNYLDRLKPDISLYKEREDNYAIIGNAILARAEQNVRPYVNHENYDILKKTFDPIRIKLRVMPINRVPQTQGMNSDYYFKEAAKKSLAGDLTHGIELLKRGLLLKPNHFLCRFNHGVLMFKFGLVQEAAKDFESIIKDHPKTKEYWVYFNHAICLMLLEVPVLDKKAIDFHQMQDPLNRNTHHFNPWWEELEQESNCNKKKQSPQNQKVKSNYQKADENCHYIIKALEEVKSMHSEKLDTELYIDTLNLRGIIKYRMGFALEAIKYLNFARRQEEIYSIKHTHFSELDESSDDQSYDNNFLNDEMNQENEVNSSSPLKQKKTAQQLLEKQLEEMSKPKEGSLTLKSLAEVLKLARMIKQEQKQNLDPNVFSPSIFKGSDLFTRFGNTIKEKLDSERRKLGMKRREYERFLKEYYSIKSMSDQLIDKEQPHIRCRKMYLRDSKDEEYKGLTQEEITELKKRKEMIIWIEKEIEDYAELVRATLHQSIYNKIHRNFINVADDIDPDEQLRKQDFEAYFMEMILATKPIRCKPVENTEDSGIQEIQQTQYQQIREMNNLQSQFDVCQIEWNQDIQKNEMEIHSKEWTDKNEREMKLLRGDQQIDEDIPYTQDVLIKRLQQCLHKKLALPDEIISVLQNELFEREFQIKQTTEGMKGISQRFTCQHIEILRAQFSNKPRQRNIKVLDKMLRHLKYMKKQDRSLRKQIYRSAQMIQIQSQTTIFKAGDEGDYMYIILKGLVAVSIQKKQYGINQVINTLKDGDSFGELALIDLKEFEDQSKPKQKRKRAADCISVENSWLLRIDTQSAKDLTVQKMDTSLRERRQTTKPRKRQERDSNSLRSDKDFKTSLTMGMKKGKGDRISQDTKQSGSVQGTKTLSAERSDGSVSLQETDRGQNNVSDLAQRILFLKQYSFFEHLSPQELMPLAFNMNLSKFRYGEILQKEGTVPDGLYLVKSGRCRVVLSREATVLLRREIRNKLTIDEKNDLFRNYDPELSLLNAIKDPNTMKQNAIHHVEDGQQIREKLVYEDIIQYGQIMPGNFFGGRVLPPFEIYMNLRRVYFGQDYIDRPIGAPTLEEENEERYQLKSFLHVIAESGVVEVYKITRQEMSFLSEKNQQDVYDKIIQIKEPDRPAKEDKIAATKKKHIKDDKERKDRVLQVIRDHKIAKYGVMAVKDVV